LGAMTVVIVSVNSGGGRGGEDERDDEDDTAVAKATAGAFVIGHGIVGKDIPIMARLAGARRWSKR
jgi:hypothetical protein